MPNRWGVMFIPAARHRVTNPSTLASSSFEVRFTGGEIFSGKKSLSTESSKNRAQPREQGLRSGLHLALMGDEHPKALGRQRVELLPLIVIPVIERVERNLL